MRVEMNRHVFTPGDTNLDEDTSAQIEKFVLFLRLYDCNS